MFPGAAGSRKVSSAPCSRSNSGGESKSRKWPSSPGRGGVHVGRSSPVWQVRRGGGFSEAVKRSSEKMKSKRRMEITYATIIKSLYRNFYDQAILSGLFGVGMLQVANADPDQVDSFAFARDSEIHEAARRIVSVLLKQTD
ncbi:hypothetical protein GH714_000338 [Hevea brasiliensis]|uniref:Uncharacterized protein n=1 Tax=Hevea brasiliensis TaxID=3981 RepID=A0A6A6M9A5_HEVBR|nr:hypothetical protein GH714_000338 [Hevea brasiliensis]